MLDLPLFVREEALCAQVDPDLWFEVNDDLVKEAVSICHQCPVMEECRQFSIDHRIYYGVWGGMTGPQRRRKYRIREEDDETFDQVA